MHRFTHRRTATVVAVAVAGLTTVLSCTLAPVASAAPASTRTAGSAAMAGSGASDDWFVDPRTRVERRAEIAVPRDAKGYDGKVRRTRAVYRTHAGDLAVPVHYAFGHTVEKGQAVTLDGKSLFRVNSVELTAHARQQLGRLALALVNASAIRCEGYADYAGTVKRNRDLARGRAEAVCNALAATNAAQRTDTTAYGPTHPAVVGGKSEDRRLNRRVVVQMTGTRPASPPPPATPPTTTLPTTPDAPSLTTVEGQRGALAFTFVAPAEDGGSPITGYEASVGDGWLPIPAAPSTHQAATLSGLAPGSKSLRVRAVNTIGVSAPSNSLEAQVFDVPSAPTDLTVAGGIGELTTTFGAPGTDGGSPVTRFEVSYDGGETWEEAVIDGEAPWTVVREGLADGTYDVRVRAVNAWGPGPAAGAEALVTSVPPNAPTISGFGYNSISEAWEVSFNAGADNGATITGYEASVNGGPWIAAAEVVPTTNGLTARFPCVGGGCGWNYGTPVRLRAVTATSASEPSQPWVHDLT